MPRLPRKASRYRFGSRPQSRPRIRPAGPWKHGPIPVLGLIGGIGAGKSRVAGLLAERAPSSSTPTPWVMHCSISARCATSSLVGSGSRSSFPRLTSRSKAKGKVKASRLPIGSTGERLGAIVFADPAARKQLEAIVHPRMRRTFERAIARTIRRGQARAVVLDAAILLEAGWDSLCDRIIFVDASPEVRLRRLEAARGWTAESLQAREAAQWPLSAKRDRADPVIANDTDDNREPAAVLNDGTVVLANNDPLRGEVGRLADALFPVSQGPETKRPEQPTSRSGPSVLPRRSL